MPRDSFGSKFNLTIRTVAILITVLVLLTVGAFCIGNGWETIGADELVVMQDPLDGELHWWTTPGMKFQNFGHTEHYKKSSQFWFSAAKDQGKEQDQSIKVRFNDNGHGNISGSLRFDLPLDAKHLTLLHSKFGSQTAIELQLIRTVVERAVYMSGPLMSSRESAAERRSDLILYIEDQVVNGVYKTRTDETKIVDPLSGKEKTVSVVRLVMRDGAPNGIARQETSPLQEFGIRAYNFSLNSITYDENVEKQITEQQKILMQVQTAMAGAKAAEQKAITVAKEGEADAMTAKWKQETIKAQAVTQGQQEKEVALLVAQKEKEVAELSVQTAELYKRQQILRGEGDAAKKRAIMAADGALEIKINAWLEAQKAYAEALKAQRWVPEVTMGAGGSGNSAFNMIDLIGLKTARDLALDMRMKGQGQ